MNQDHSAPTSGREVISVLDRDNMVRHTANSCRFPSVSGSARTPGRRPNLGVWSNGSARRSSRIKSSSSPGHIEKSKIILYARPYTVLVL